MTTSKTALKSLIAIAAISATLTGMSASAQIRPDRHDDHRGAPSDSLYARSDAQINARIETIRDRIAGGKRTHRLSSREASRLLSRLNNINALKVSYMRTGRGLDRNETATLQSKLDMLSGDIRDQGHDGNRR